jgi:hypothetical protein
MAFPRSGNLQENVGQVMLVMAGSGSRLEVLKRGVSEIGDHGPFAARLCPNEEVSPDGFS